MVWRPCRRITTRTDTQGKSVKVACCVPPVVRHKDNLPSLHHAVLDPLTRRKSPVHLATVVALAVRRSRKVGRRHVPKLRPSDQAEPSDAVLHHLHAAVTAPKRQDAALHDACEEIRHLSGKCGTRGERSKCGKHVCQARRVWPACVHSSTRKLRRGGSGEEDYYVKVASVAPPSRGRWPPGTRSRQQRRPARQ